MENLRWKVCRFDEISSLEMFYILKLRQDVFVVEQNCAYHDIDDLDRACFHVFAYSDAAAHSDQPSMQADFKGANSLDPEVLAYARLVPPNLKFREPAVGRVVVAQKARGAKLGYALMRQVLDFADDTYPGAANRISAQEHLKGFYGYFGYEVVSDVYDEDGIPHVEMLRPAPDEQAKG
jgi:ElaA protein